MHNNRTHTLNTVRPLRVSVIERQVVEKQHGTGLIVVHSYYSIPPLRSMHLAALKHLLKESTGIFPIHANSLQVVAMLCFLFRKLEQSAPADERTETMCCLLLSNFNITYRNGSNDDGDMYTPLICTILLPAPNTLDTMRT